MRFYPGPILWLFYTYSIQFPAREIISENSFVIDEKIAEFYYQVNFYYDSFEKKFKEQTLFLSK